MSDQPNYSGPSLFDRQRDLKAAIIKNRFTLAYGSARGGKSFAIAEAIITRALKYDNSNHLVLRLTGNSVKGTIWKTFEEVLRGFNLTTEAHVKKNTVELVMTLYNGSTITFTGVQDQERIAKILGAEFVTIFLNEATEIDYPTYEMVASRLNGNVYDANGKRCELKLIADCNPTSKMHWLYQLFVRKVVPGSVKPLTNPDPYGTLHFDADANPSVDPHYYADYANKTAQAQKRFLEGEWSDEVEGALFKSEDIEAYRRDTPAIEDFDLTVVSVDPAATSTDTSDETGIIVAGKIDGHSYIIEDLSCKLPAQEWARIAIKAYHHYGAGCIRIETNQGGEAWAAIIRQIDPRVTIKHFHASVGQGKNVRAQPVAAELAGGRLHLPLTPLKELESQMLAMTGDYDRKKGKSPDRLDAMVYAVAELVLSNSGPSRVFAAKTVGFWR